MTAKRFADCFWGPGDRGYDVILSRMKTSKHTCTDLTTYFQFRAELEEDYARKLQSLTKKITTIADETGTFREVLECLTQVTDIQAKTHAHLAEELKLRVIRPMNEFTNRQRDIRKKHQTQMERTIKMKQQQTAVVLKAQEKFHAKSSEVETIDQNRATARSDKEMDKLDGKHARAQSQANQADQDYWNAIDKLREVHTVWVKEIFHGFEQFQGLEEERLAFCRDLLWQFANSCSTVCVRDDEANERLRKNLERCKVDIDIQAFIREKTTGEEIPPPMAYRKYGSPEAISSSQKSLDTGVTAAAAATGRRTSFSFNLPNVISAIASNRRASSVSNNDVPVTVLKAQEGVDVTSDAVEADAWKDAQSSQELAESEVSPELVHHNELPRKTHVIEESEDEHKNTNPFTFQEDSPNPGSIFTATAPSSPVPLDLLPPIDEPPKISSPDIDETNPFAEDLEKAKSGTSTPSVMATVAATMSANSSASTNPFDPFIGGHQTPIEEVVKVSKPGSLKDAHPQLEVLFQVRVVKNFDAQKEDQLTLDRGQIVSVLKADDPGWYYGELKIGKHKSYGYFPTDAVNSL